jgi:hypothetical protein
MEEVQSAYWNQSMVTLHPVVIYYKSIEDGKETLHHKSFTIISDELSHRASTHTTLCRVLPRKYCQLALSSNSSWWFVSKSNTNLFLYWLVGLSET